LGGRSWWPGSARRQSAATGGGQTVGAFPATEEPGTGPGGNSYKGAASPHVTSRKSFDNDTGRPRAHVSHRRDTAFAPVIIPKSSANLLRCFWPRSSERLQIFPCFPSSSSVTGSAIFRPKNRKIFGCEVAGLHVINLCKVVPKLCVVSEL
jgi:hypothetical protein